MFVADVAILLIAAWRFDRGRKVGARTPYLDENRPDFSSSFTNEFPPLPTEAIETAQGPSRRPLNRCYDAGGDRRRRSPRTA